MELLMLRYHSAFFHQSDGSLSTKYANKISAQMKMNMLRYAMGKYIDIDVYQTVQKKTFTTGNLTC